MKIVISENYYIGADTRQYILYKKVLRKGEVAYNPAAYHSKLSALIVIAFERSVREDIPAETDIEDIGAQIDLIADGIKKAVEELTFNQHKNRGEYHGT